MSAFLVIWPPQVSDTAESLMACLLGWPSEPFGWNASNSAVRSFFGLLVGQRLRADLHGGRAAAADDDHRFGGLAQRLAEHVLDLLGADVPVAPAAGIDTLVPPSKSMPKVKPRSTMLAIATATIRPLIANHILRRPMTSNAPVPV